MIHRMSSAHFEQVIVELVFASESAFYSSHWVVIDGLGSYSRLIDDDELMMERIVKRDEQL
jgi:hypothetical protein